MKTSKGYVAPEPLDLLKNDLSAEPAPGRDIYPPVDDDALLNENDELASTEDKAGDDDPLDTDSSDDPNWNEKDFSDDLTGEDLDVPGSEETEDGGEIPGKEDEENEYYSLGGEDHEELDEDNG